MSTQKTTWKTKIDEYARVNNIKLNAYTKTDSDKLQAGDNIIYFAIRRGINTPYVITHKKCIYGGMTKTYKYKFYRNDYPGRFWFISGTSNQTVYIIYRQYRIDELMVTITNLNKKITKLTKTVNDLAGAVEESRKPGFY